MREPTAYRLMARARNVFMDMKRREENRDAVASFLRRELGGRWVTGEPSDDSGVSFHSHSLGMGSLHLDASLLEGEEPRQLVRRLADDRVGVHLKEGRIVTVTSQTTTLKPMQREASS